MKIFLLLLILTPSLYAQRTISETYTYSEGVTFNLIRITHAKTSEYGNNPITYMAGKGNHFKGAIVEFSNTTKEDIFIDFRNVFLVDAGGERHPVHSVVQSMKFTTTMERFKQKLHAGKTKTFMMNFWPEFSKTEVVSILLFNGQEVLFTFK